MLITRENISARILELKAQQASASKQFIALAGAIEALETLLKQDEALAASASVDNPSKS